MAKKKLTQQEKIQEVEKRLNSLYKIHERLIKRGKGEYAEEIMQLIKKVQSLIESLRG